MRLSLAKSLRDLTLAACAVTASTCANAGTWGDESWGQMYWGSNTTSAPLVAPTVSSIVADDSNLIVTIDDFQPGEDGWSGITTYAVSCGPPGTVNSSNPVVSVSGLEPDTEYECSVVASNAIGASPTTVTMVTTDPALQGLNVVIIRSALCKSNNPPPSCQ